MASQKTNRITTKQVKAARELLGWNQYELATAAGLSIVTVGRLEAVDGPLGGLEETYSAIVNAFETVGVEFIGGERPGVRLGVRKGARR